MPLPIRGHPQRPIQQEAQRRVPNQGNYNGNPGTVYNTPPRKPIVPPPFPIFNRLPPYYRGGF